MNLCALAVLALMAGMVLSSGAKQDEVEKSSQSVLHTRQEFRFTVQAPMEAAAPLFGANEERNWAPGWNPQFLQPTPARDELGAVFTVQHATGNAATWVMTAADFAGGHIQYVYVIPEVMTTLIDIHLNAQGAKTTGVHVVYERTALRAEANGHVEHFASRDAEQGPEWEAQINGYLRKQGKTKQN